MGVQTARMARSRALQTIDVLHSNVIAAVIRNGEPFVFMQAWYYFYVYGKMRFFVASNIFK